MDFQQKLAKY